MGGVEGPPQRQDSGLSLPASPRARWRCGVVMPSRNSLENPAMAPSGRRSARRPVGVKARWTAASFGSWLAFGIAGTRAVSHSLASAGSLMPSNKKRAALNFP